jgi:hypothetical protein
MAMQQHDRREHGQQHDDDGSDQETGGERALARSGKSFRCRRVDVPSPSARLGLGGGRRRRSLHRRGTGIRRLPRWYCRPRRAPQLRETAAGFAGAVVAGAVTASAAPGAVAAGRHPRPGCCDSTRSCRHTQAGQARARGATGGGGGAVRSSGVACGGGGFNCAPTSKISPGPGWIFVVGERGAACVNGFESSSSETSLPAFADSPRSVNSRWPSFPRTLRSSSCVSHVSSGSRCVMSSSACTVPGKAYFALEREVVLTDPALELGAKGVGHAGSLPRLVRLLMERDRLLALLPHGKHERRQDRRDHQ